jgi:hypothetical protein
VRRPWARPAATLAALAAAGAGLLPSAVGAEFGGPAARGGPSTCSTVTVGSSSDTGRLIHLDAGAKITCSQPTSAAFSEPNHPNPPPPQPPVPGTPCTNTRWQPYTWSEHPVFEGQGGNLPGGVSYDPDGKFTSYEARTGLAAGIDPGTHNWYNVFQEKSTWQADGTCKVIPGQWANTQWVVLPHGITAANSPYDPVQVQTLIAQFAQNLTTHPATIGTTPPATQGLVNLPQCFWLDGLQPDQYATATLPGGADPTGRSIYYQLYLQATLAQVAWDFGDGGSGHQVTPPPAACGNHPQQVAYDYVRISGADTRFQVYAHQDWHVSSTLYYVDSGGVEPPVQIPVGQPVQQVVSGPIGVYIGQLEGVPSN